MNQTRVMVAILEMARMDLGFPADEAISKIAAMMDRLDPASETYWEEMNTLAKIGATVWNLAQFGPDPH